MEGTLQSAMLRFRGSGVRLLQLAIPKKLQLWHIDSGKEWNRLIFDLETYENIRLPGVHSWQDLVCLKEWFGLDPSVPGSIELKTEKGQTLKIKPSHAFSPNLFSETNSPQMDIRINFEQHRLWVMERSIGLQGSWKSAYTAAELSNQQYIQRCRFYWPEEQCILIRPTRFPGRLFKKQKKNEENLIRELRVLG